MRDWLLRGADCSAPVCEGDDWTETIQSWLKYKASVTKITGTPPYSPNPWAELAHFLAKGHSSDCIWTHPGGPLRELGVGPISPPQIRNSKIALVRPNTIRWGASSQKMSQFGPGVWAVGGGASDLRTLVLYFNHFCSSVFRMAQTNCFLKQTPFVLNISNSSIRIICWNKNWSVIYEYFDQ